MQSGTEGVNRNEISKKLGINVFTKAGNRRVSDSIQKAIKYFPDLIGQYQKTEGKFRTLRSFFLRTTSLDYFKFELDETYNF